MTPKYVPHGLAALSAIWLLASGCKTENTQLESVNKDWNRIIRASHIYPVYPLSEDLEPGDIFFVSTQIEDLSTWNTPGYIKLDHQIGRLYPTNYADFYGRSFKTSTNDLPHFWLQDNSWLNAPLAAFPSYSFSVQQGGGANISLPIEGIPVGLGLMGAKSASGHVTLADAHTYGVDELTLDSQVEDFVEKNRGRLLDLVTSQSHPNNPYYLQVISRVYVVQRVSVSMYNDSAWSGTLSGGVPKDVPIPDLQTSNAAANYSNMVGAVNSVVSSLKTAVTAVGGVAPGGTLKFTAASSRSVSMEETFPRPLVIGYTGFNVLISRTNLDVGISGGKIHLKRVSNASLIKDIKSAK